MILAAGLEMRPLVEVELETAARGVARRSARSVDGRAPDISVPIGVRT
jgi:hypothetical protein